MAQMKTTITNGPFTSIVVDPTAQLTSKYGNVGEVWLEQAHPVAEESTTPRLQTPRFVVLRLRIGQKAKFQ